MKMCHLLSIKRFMSECYRLKMGELLISKNQTITTYLGSCVGIVFIGESRCAMAHCILPLRSDDVFPFSKLGKFVDESVMYLFRKLRHEPLEAYLYGGASMLVQSSTNVGRENIRIAREMISKTGVPLVQDRTGGESATVITLNCKTKEVVYKRINPTALVEVEE